MFIRGKKKVHITKPTRHGKRFMEEDRDAVRLLNDYRAGKFFVGGGR